MLIFALDSSAVSASAAVIEDDKVLAEYYVNIKQTHSQTLMIMAEQLLRAVGRETKDFDLMAVSSGPGSFTGVRIAVSCVKGMAMPFDTPCCGVSTLEVIAHGAVSLEGKTICSVMDARCGQVYNALFRAENGELIRLCADRAITVDKLSEELTRYPSAVLIGDGSDICFKSIECPGISIADPGIRYQHASSVGFVSKKYEPVSPDRLIPTYLRMPQAERNLKNSVNASAGIIT